MGHRKCLILHFRIAYPLSTTSSSCRCECSQLAQCPMFTLTPTSCLLDGRFYCTCHTGTQLSSPPTRLMCTMPQATLLCSGTEEVSGLCTEAVLSPRRTRS